MNLDNLLLEVKQGTLSIEQAKSLLQCAPYEEMGFAKLDTHRQIRSGFNEVVFCQGKAQSHLNAIFKTLYEKEGRVLGTRCSLEQYEGIREALPTEKIDYDPLSRTIRMDSRPINLTGSVAICTAGTADLAVAEECAKCAEFFGTRVSRFYDVGVSGLHRLLSQLPEIQKANCVVAIAGMEGALASVIGGLVENPVIAVPTSVGYGANFHGLSALLTMLNSCSNGVCTVNIDNGFGAAYLATQMNRLALKK